MKTMSNHRWAELMTASKAASSAAFTEQEREDGWHFCSEQGGMLLADSEGPMCEVCGYAPSENEKEGPQNESVGAPPACVTDSEGTEDPLHSLVTTLAYTSRDMSVQSDLAWVYGIVCGWDDESLAEFRIRFKWTENSTDRLKRLHASYVDIAAITSHVDHVDLCGSRDEVAAWCDFRATPETAPPLPIESTNVDPRYGDDEATRQYDQNRLKASIWKDFEAWVESRVKVYSKKSEEGS